MKPVKQEIVNDCFRACMASMLELPNKKGLPHIDKESWYSDWNELLSYFGMRLVGDHKKIWREGFWIASVPSLNFKDVRHAIIMFDTKVFFDPSTKKRYRKGTNLLKKHEMVTWGWWLEVSDVSKLKELDKFREKLEG